MVEADLPLQGKWLLLRNALKFGYGLSLHRPDSLEVVPLPFAIRGAKCANFSTVLCHSQTPDFTLCEGLDPHSGGHIRIKFLPDKRQPGQDDLQQ